MDRLLPVPMILRQRVRHVLEALLQGTEHQRQWRSELVADVAEEHRLGSIDVRQRLGSLALLFMRPAVHDGGRDVTGHQVEERSVVLVERAAGVDTQHDQAGDLVVRREKQRQRDGLCHGFGPDAVGKLQSADIGRPPVLERRAESVRRDGVLGKRPARVQEIRPSERNIALVLTECRLGSRAGIDDRMRLHGLRRQPAQRSELPRAHDLARRFVAGAEDALDGL